MAIDQGGDVFQVAGFTPLKSINNDIPWSETLSEIGDIVQIDFGRETHWNLTIEYSFDDRSVWLVFGDAVSHRVHDEREISHYWEQRSDEGVLPAYAYEINQSPYLRELANGVTAAMNKTRPLRHFLAGGLNTCVEVIAFDVPRISYSKPTS